MNRIIGSLVLVLAALGALTGCEKNHPTRPPVGLVNADSLQIVPDSAFVAVGQTFRFTVFGYDSLGGVVNPQLTVHSTNPAVFTVDNSVRVTGINAGTALLVVSSGNASDTAVVTVVATDQGWLDQTSNVHVNLRAVYFQQDGLNGWAVGEGGTLLRTQSGGDVWAAANSGTTQRLNALAFRSDFQGWAVGRSGTIVHTTDSGANWTRMTGIVTDAELNGIAFANVDTGFVVGSGGTMLRTTNGGGSWTQVASPTTSDLNAIAFSTTRDGWAVGNNGLILGTHDRGRTWFTVLPNPAASDLRSVVAVAIGASYAVGGLGAAPYTVSDSDTSRWVIGNAGSNYELYGVSFASAEIGYAVGLDTNTGGGVILRTGDHGLTWQQQAGHSPTPLYGVYFTSDTRGWAVGNGGTILRTSSGGQSALRAAAGRVARR